MKETKSKSGRLKRSNKRSDKSTSSESSEEESEGEGSDDRGGGRRKQSEDSDSEDDTEDEPPPRKRVSRRLNDIRRRKEHGTSSRKNSVSIRRRGKVHKKGRDGSHSRHLRSHSKEISKSKARGPRIVVGDKNLAGKICLQLKSGRIILANGKREDRRERTRKVSCSGKTIPKKNLRRRNHEVETESESRRSHARHPRRHKRPQGTSLEEMESFLDELRARKEEAEKSGGEAMSLFPQSGVHGKEAKFLDRVRAKRKAKPMACLDTNSSHKTVAKEAKFLADLNKSDSSDVSSVTSSNDDEEDSSEANEKDKSELLQKLKAETKAVLMGDKGKHREKQKQNLK